ncbi:MULTISPECIES: glutamic-type intramembrane protease PrsW [Bacillus]|uniref:glutamic-type intramembrane protease PrsW n=1 Tax=Bacillus TaxID=1386 RepID=UPI00031C9FEB|nr:MULTISPECIES: glutamic-type intramembrane protease PrsW [Bacillus]
MLVIITAGIAPGLALLSYFYLRDYYGTEPILIVLRTFLLGAILVFPIMFIQYILEVEHIITSDLISSFVATGFLEEFFKWFIIMYTIYYHASFDEPYDGIVYGSAVSLGFATTENIFYLVANGVEYAFGRALLPVSSHALFGVIMGYYFGKGKFTKEKNNKYLFLAFFIPYNLHGLYDYILLKQFYWLYFIVPFMIFLWWFGLRKIKKARQLSDIHASEMMN